MLRWNLEKGSGIKTLRFFFNPLEAESFLPPLIQVGGKNQRPKHLKSGQNLTRCFTLNLVLLCHAFLPGVSIMWGCLLGCAAVCGF
jgi:hypothetical protein